MEKRKQVFVLGGLLALGVAFVSSNRATRTARAGLKAHPEMATSDSVVVVPGGPAPLPTSYPLQAPVPAREPKANNDRKNLHPEFGKRLELFLADAKKKGFRVLVYECYRLPDRQAWLWSYGRLAPNKAKPKVTWTLDSLHRYGLAADLVTLKPNGAADWSHAAFDRLYAACPPAKYGLELVAGEKPHLQLEGGQRRPAELGIRRDFRLPS